MPLIENAPNGEDTNPASTKKIPVDGGYFIQLVNLVKNLGAAIKTAYEGQPDTNAYDDAAVTKLSGIEALADVTDAANVEDAITGVSADTLTDASVLPFVKTATLVKITWANFKAALEAAYANLTKTIEDGADVTDATNVNAAGAVMESDFTAKGNILAATAASTPTPLTVGADNTVLTADAAESTGMKWATVSAGSAVDITISVRKGSSGTIAKGTPVYLSGYNASGWYEVEPADADDATKMPAIGIAGADITNLATGTLTLFGTLTGMDTSAFAVKDALYVSTTGTLTSTRPTGATAGVQKLGVVGRSNVSTGVIFVAGAFRSNDIPNRQSDAYFRIADDGDLTKLLAFQVSGIATGTTRTITVPDANLDLTPGTGDFEDAGVSVLEADYNANTVLAANADNTPLPLTVTEQTVVGRITGGNIAALSVAQLQALVLSASLPENSPVWLDAALSADGKYSGIVATLTGGAVLAYGDLCYLASADGRMELADADAEGTTKPLLAIALEAFTDGSTGKFLLFGFVREDDWAWTNKGAPLFVSATAGDMTETAPSTTGQQIRRVGSIIDADSIMFNPSPDWLELA